MQRDFDRWNTIKKATDAANEDAAPLTTATKPNPYRLPIGIVDDKQAFAKLSQLRNIDSKRLVKKIAVVSADALEVIKKEASRVNFG